MTDAIDWLERVIYAVSLVIVYALLLLPIVIVILTSFTTQSAPTLPQGEWTLEWYRVLSDSKEIMDAMVVSLTVGVLTALVAGTVGTVTALGFVRSDFEYRETLATMLLLPLLISPVITGVALLRFTGLFNIPRGIPTLVLAHSTLALPFVFLIVRASLVTFDNRLEDASRTLGASGVETTLNVTLPNVAPAIITGALLAFIVSFGEFTASQFLIKPGETTIPVIIYSKISTGLTPEISALATVLVIVLVVVGAVSYVIS